MVCNQVALFPGSLLKSGGKGEGGKGEGGEGGGRNEATNQMSCNWYLVAQLTMGQTCTTVYHFQHQDGILVAQPSIQGG